MAHIEKWYRCGCCRQVFFNLSQIRQHHASHIIPEDWAVSDRFPGKASHVRNYRNVEQALKDVDTPDSLEDMEPYPRLKLYTPQKGGEET